MASVNKAIIIGHLGKDPEVRYTTGGDAVCNLRIATSERWKDKNGEQQEKTEWHSVVLFARSAENAGEYLTKGSMVFVEGRLQTREYEKDGVKKYSTEIVGDRIQYLDKKPEGGGERERPARAPAGKPAPTGGSSRTRKGDDFDDDIPFISSTYVDFVQPSPLDRRLRGVSR